MKLTHVRVEKLKPELKEKKYFDGDGLYLLVKPNGTKSWRLKYNFLKKERLLTFGTYPEISLKEARDKRFEARQLLSKGIDPNTEKQEKKRIAIYNSQNTFFAVAKEWHDINKDKWSKRHGQKIWSWFERYVFPVIGNKPIDQVTGLEIIDEIIRKIERQGKTETSHALLHRISAVFRFAFLTRRVPYNPLADLKGVLKPHKVTHYPTIRIDELKEFNNRLESINVLRLHKLAIKMLLLTFVRQGELRKSKWEHFNFDTKMWIIPIELTKTKKVEHLVPLSCQTIAVLKEIQKISGKQEYLFPTINLRKHPYMNENTINNILKDMGYKGKLVGHGFRSLTSTTLNELGCQPDVIEKQLAHIEQNKVKKAYNRAIYLPQRIELMQKWADHIDCIINN